jgi:hypothetical protein
MPDLRLGDLVVHRTAACVGVVAGARALHPVVTGSRLQTGVDAAGRAVCDGYDVVFFEVRLLAYVWRNTSALVPHRSLQLLCPLDPQVQRVPS